VNREKENNSKEKKYKRKGKRKCIKKDYKDKNRFNKK